MYKNKKMYKSKNMIDAVERPMSFVQTHLMMIIKEYVQLSPCFKTIKTTKSSELY